MKVVKKPFKAGEVSTEEEIHLKTYVQLSTVHGTTTYKYAIANETVANYVKRSNGKDFTIQTVVSSNKICHNFTVEKETDKGTTKVTSVGTLRVGIVKPNNGALVKKPRKIERRRNAVDEDEAIVVENMEPEDQMSLMSL